MIAILIMVINKAIKDIFFISCLFEIVHTANTKDTRVATMIKIIIKNTNCSVVAIAIGSKRIIERVTSKLKIKNE